MTRDRFWRATFYTYGSGPQQTVTFDAVPEGEYVKGTYADLGIFFSQDNNAPSAGIVYGPDPDISFGSGKIVAISFCTCAGLDSLTLTFRDPVSGQNAGATSFSMSIGSGVETPGATSIGVYSTDGELLTAEDVITTFGGTTISYSANQLGKRIGSISMGLIRPNDHTGNYGDNFKFRVATPQ